MATRETYGSASVGPIAGDAFMDNVGGHFGRLYDASCLPLTARSTLGIICPGTCSPQ